MTVRLLFITLPVLYTLSLLLLFALFALLAFFGLVVGECLLERRILISGALTHLNLEDVVVGAEPLYYLLQTVVVKDVVICEIVMSKILVLLPAEFDGAHNIVGIIELIIGD